MPNHKGVIIMKVLASLVCFIIFGIVIVGSSYIIAYNKGNEYEKRLEALYANNQNVLSTYYQKVQEVAQVPGMMKDDLKDVINSSLQGRYGKDGAKAVFLAIKETYPGTVDSKLYVKIQQVIESGRNDFRNAQTEMIDVKRIYDTDLGSFWTGTMLRLAGYPKVDMNKFKVITTVETKTVFERGTESGPVKLR